MGLGVYSVQLAQALGKKDCVIIALNDKDEYQLRTEFPAFFENALFRTIPVPHFAFPDPRQSFQALLTCWRIFRHKTDVLHVLIGSIYPESYLSLWMAHKMGLPLVATLHDTRLHPGDFLSLRSTWLELHALELCSQVIVHGQHMANDLMTHFGIDERVINVIPHGNYDIYLKAEGASPASGPEPGQVLLFGRIKKYKGLDVVIDATPIVAEKIPNLKIIIAGRGEELNRFEPQLKDNPFFEIHNRYVPAREVGELFSSSSLVVIPYIEASQSGPLHLAYTWGRPVVASSVGAIPESLRHGMEGLLVPPNDPRALAVGMIKVLRNTDLARNLGRSARIKAEKELNWEGDISEKVRIVYQRAIEMQRKKISYPGIGAKERWNRAKDDYYRTVRNGH
jgi:glycosyltransferase involved in cell wall biosynthesis